MVTGGWDRNRTGLDGFAVRSMTTLPPSLGVGETLYTRGCERQLRQIRQLLLNPDVSDGQAARR